MQYMWPSAKAAIGETAMMPFSNGDMLRDNVRFTADVSVARECAPAKNATMAKRPLTSSGAGPPKFITSAHIRRTCKVWRGRPPAGARRHLLEAWRVHLVSAAVCSREAQPTARHCGEIDAMFGSNAAGQRALRRAAVGRKPSGSRVRARLGAAHARIASTGADGSRQVG